MKGTRLKWLAPLCAGIAAIAIAAAYARHESAAGAGPAALQAPHGHDRRDFALEDVNGSRVTLATFRGKWVLLFFGYTSCPDICPTALLNVANTLDAMGEAAKRLQPVFITVDPERDTGAVLKTYLASFGGHIVGLTGTPAQIAAAAGAYQTYFVKHPTGDGGYMIEHSSAFALLSPDGRYVRAFRPDDDPKDFAKELLTAMNEDKP